MTYRLHIDHLGNPVARRTLSRRQHRRLQLLGAVATVAVLVFIFWPRHGW